MEKKNGVKEISVNTSTCCKFLRSTAMRSSKDANAAFKVQLNSFALVFAQRSAAKAGEREVKTIDEEDVLAANKELLGA